jgi:hypothetical protein
MGRATWALRIGFVVVLAGAARAQQIADPAFDPAIGRPAYQADRGPRVAIDEAHLNFHTAGGGYAPFAALLRRDGYQVEGNRDPFTAGSLGRTDVLVVANAMHKQSEADWAPLPTLSAFTDTEVAAVETWVRGGGSLLLIADHMPLAGHAESLAAAFGVRFQNGFAQDAAGNGLLTFRRSDGTLASNVITSGRSDGERVETVVTFTARPSGWTRRRRPSRSSCCRPDRGSCSPRSRSNSRSARRGFRRPACSKARSSTTDAGAWPCSAKRRC